MVHQSIMKRLSKQACFMNSNFNRNKATDQLRLVYSDPDYQAKIKPTLLKIAKKQYNEDELKSKLQAFRDKGTLERQNYQARNKFNQYQASFSNKRHERQTDSFTLMALEKTQDIQQFYSIVATIILNGQKSPPHLPIIRANIQDKYSLIKGDLFVVLCMMSAFLIPKQRLGQKFSKKNDFSYIFSHQLFKTKCIVKYIKNVIKYSNDLSQSLQIVRLVEKATVSQLMSAFGDKYGMSDFTLKEDSANIQSSQFRGRQHLKVDFSNKRVGGGYMQGGLIQQEIIVANRPEMYAALIVVQELNDDEAIVFKGFKKYFKNRGYAETTQYAGHEQNPSPHENIVAIDAIQFRKHQIYQQYSSGCINREIKKAYAGFKYSETTDIVSGNWGCGFFNGDPRLKLLIQWIAASLAGKKLHHCPFGRKADIQYSQLFKAIKAMPIRKVYIALLKACSEMNQYSNKGKSLYFEMMSILKKGHNDAEQKVNRNYNISNQRTNPLHQQFNVPQKGFNNEMRSNTQSKGQYQTSNSAYGQNGAGRRDRSQHR